MPTFAPKMSRKGLLHHFNTLVNMNMPPVTKHLIIINLLMYLAKVVATQYGIDFDGLLGLHFFMASDFRLYQFFTYMFVHGGLEHIFFNMFAVWMFGRIMEQVMGSQRFLFYYIVCGVGAGLMQEAVQWIDFAYEGLASYDSVNMGGSIVPMDEYLNRWTTVGASGAVYGILLSFGMTFPEERLFIIPIPIPIKAKWFVMGYAVIELMSALNNPGDGIAHMAHLGGMLFGLVLILYWRRHGGGNAGNSFNFGGIFGRRDNYGGDGYYTRYEDVTNGESQSWWTKMKKKWEEKKKASRMKAQPGGKHGDDMAWRQQKKANEEEIDRILDKVKKSGYDHLTEEEKRKLFDASGR